MVREGHVGETETLLYTTKSLATGATCKIRIVDMDGTKTVDDAAMTEIAASDGSLYTPGEYKYAWTPTTSGAYMIFMFETSFDAPVKMEHELIEVRTW